MKNKLLIILGFTIICHSFEISMALPHSADLGELPCPSETTQSAPTKSKVEIKDHEIGGHVQNVAEAVAQVRMECLQRLEYQLRIDNQISAFQCKRGWPKLCIKKYSTQLQEETDAFAKTSESCELVEGIFSDYWRCNATCETTTEVEFKLQCIQNNQKLEGSGDSAGEPLLN